MKFVSYLKTITALTFVISASASLCACQRHGGQQTSSGQVSSSASAHTVNAVLPQLTSYTPGSYVPLSTCNLENVNATAFGVAPAELKVGQANVFEGWIDSAELASPDFWLHFDDSRANRYLHVPFRLTIERSDVVAAHPGAPRVSGFQVPLVANALPAGRYHVYVAVTSGGAVHICDNGRHVDVTP